MGNVYNTDYDTAIRIVRSEPTRAQINSELSLAAEGLWMRIMDLPEDADFSIEALKRSKNRRESDEDIQAAYEELLEAGYITETDS